MAEDLVILVDEKDNQIGLKPKLKAHEEGLLHRAVSVLVFNLKDEWLLQKRADHKYHSGGLWTNTCCSHPLPNESSLDAAERRLTQEMGMSCKMKKAFDFIYKVSFNNGLTENEFDHVYIAITDQKPKINTEEASDYRYINTESLLNEIKNRPEIFTDWFKIMVPLAIENLKK